MMLWMPGAGDCDGGDGISVPAPAPTSRLPAVNVPARLLQTLGEGGGVRALLGHQDSTNYSMH